ncbi:tannase subunit [Penicillium verhagenii]|nr:tannase subunit [Penicillium verhagenii]
MLKLGSGVLAAVAIAQAATLDDVCTASHAKAAIPRYGLLPGIVTTDSVITASPVYNVTVTDEVYYPDATFDYCNVTMTYSHHGKHDTVLLNLWLPAPEKFQNRWVSTGGFAFAINVEDTLPGGVIYVQLLAEPMVDSVALIPVLTMSFLSPMEPPTWMLCTCLVIRLITRCPPLGCSEGGREGLSQVQRFPEEWDGAVIGAPAIRYGQQQVNHLFPQVAQQTAGYIPPYCELEKIVNLTLSACDSLDGKVDGVVSRTDLCKLHFDFNSTIGASYYCAATSATLRKRQIPSAAFPTQSGVVTKEGADLAATIYNGLMTDAETEYDHSTELVEEDNLSTFDGVTYDTLRDWMLEGWQRYEDVLQTTWSDLSPFEAAGGKIISYHGESDNSIPPASSVRFHESVRSTMYGNETFQESTSSINDWYRLFLVPGASHCNTSSLQPNAPFPQTSLGSLIDWVEKSEMPNALNSTILSGSRKSEQQQLCAWPLRPLWRNNGTTMHCVFDKPSYDTWIYDLDA